MSEARVLTEHGEDGLDTDDDDETPVGPTEGEDEPGAAGEPPATGEPSKAQLRELDVEQERHEQAVHEIMGAYVEGFVGCDQCNGVGLVPPIPQPRTHPYFRRCQTCNGYGEVLTGALEGVNRSRACPACLGRGYLEAIGEGGAPLAGQPATATMPAIPPAAATTDGGAAGADGEGGEVTFGVPSWMGNPDIGPGS
jgi:hypothetical protein